MRFLVDMPLSIETAAFLRQLGHDTVHLREQGLQRLPDRQITEKARTERRTIVTMDLGFGHLLAFAQSQYPSVILFRIEDECPDNIHRLLKKYLPLIHTDLESGALVSISGKGPRVHRLPIQPAP